MEHKASLGDFDGTLLLIGAGKMGGAMLEGWHRLGLRFDNVVLIEPQPSPEVLSLAEGRPRRALLSNNVFLLEPQPSPEIITLGQRGLRINPALDTFAASAIVIAVKPQVATQLSATLAPLIGRDPLVISIMAGRTLAFLEKALPAGTALVRAMPNMPAAIGRGITVAVPNARVSGAQRDLADQLLAAAGATEWVADEALMDAVTAVSGSGPAYVFLLAESLARAGVAAGLPPDLAARLP